jgi:hypothetical protein
MAQWPKMMQALVLYISPSSGLCRVCVAAVLLATPHHTIPTAIKKQHVLSGLAGASPKPSNVGPRWPVGSKAQEVAAAIRSLQ